MLFPSGVRHKPLEMVTVKAFAKFLGLCAVLSNFACTQTAVLYDLKTNDVIKLEFDDNWIWSGGIRGTAPSGQAVSGEYRLFTRDDRQGRKSKPGDSGTNNGTSGRIVPTGQELEASGDYAWATKLGFQFNAGKTKYPNAELKGIYFGSASVSGKNIDIDCIMKTLVFRQPNFWKVGIGADIITHRSGVCRDNKGGKYRLEVSVTKS
jgi:hypothetical protein